MSWRPQVLIVARTPSLGQNLFSWLSEVGYNAVLVTSFASGKAHLQSGTALLVAEIRLEDYNGLHLAVRARAHDIPAIVIGNADPVLERDAAQLGAIYLTPDSDKHHVADVADRLTGGPIPTLSFVSSGDFAAAGSPGRWGRAEGVERRMLN